MAEVAELSVREERSGHVADLVEVTPAGRSPSGRSAIMILIHGYNVSQERARKVYSMFLRALARVYRPKPIKAGFLRAKILS